MFFVKKSQCAKNPFNGIIASKKIFIFGLIKKNIMKLFKKKTEKATVNVAITKLDKNQLETLVGGATEGTPIGGIIVKGGLGPGGELGGPPVKK